MIRRSRPPRVRRSRYAPPAAPAPKREGSPARVLAVIGIVITTVTGGLGLLFTLQPNLKPCLGDSSASFTGAPVFGRVEYRQHLLRNGWSQEDVDQEPDIQGAEVRFSYRTSGYRGERLRVTWSLIRVARDGTPGAVDAAQDRAVAMEVEPETCSESGGNDLFVQIPEPGARYSVVLELYRQDQLDDRLAFTVTDPFQG